MRFNYDVIVVGAGHAGCEAACSAANMGAKTVLITMDMNKIAQMSCNPAIGGVAKGQIIREIDALGGKTGIVTDRSAIQFRMLNESKGPAMWSPRAQCDRISYIQNWRNILENTPNLHIYQDQVKEIIVNGKVVTGVRTWWGVEFYAKSVIITAGTFLNGLMHIGRNMLPGGRCSEPAETNLTKSITVHGITVGRMKTGTPVRLDARSIDFSCMEMQPIQPEMYKGEMFSYFEKTIVREQIPCWIAYTNKECHDVLRSGFNDSPLYNGQIQSIGPRYCPSIETKLTVFPDKEQHHLFLEPEGKNTNEMYLNGFSSSLPIEIQIEALKKIPAFRDVVLYRPGYAIEYDFFDPTQLKHTLESTIIEGLFFAGQVNGTTGYEEAAGQGIVAGINAALRCVGNDTFVLKRDESYIGVLIDDLVLKGVDEPYRMFTSRSEYRILLRQDNADIRLTGKSHAVGLATELQNEIVNAKKSMIEHCKAVFSGFKVKPAEINGYLTDNGKQLISEGCSVESIIKKPDITLYDIINVYKGKITDIITDNECFSTYFNLISRTSEGIEKNTVLNEIMKITENLIKYEPYIKKEEAIAKKNASLDFIKIGNNIDYSKLTQLTMEARQKLMKYKPNNIGMASRIPGISPNDINILLLLLGK